ncbi:bifunctional 2-polyprenyl-6-hydroxyphenol methylase/3-demethylubiquinol 3-O-methyltransferase UbiG [Halobacillus sp. A5]|uniref:class I SAM-dependent methyltransferase n=1 Tax=Halobacillus sp. A5 TaxID=2880263 RepID=UPI0020A6C8CC|nr:methyltransferase domain-containing protein [Halobacillus sp. A5]MCP3029430.1 methyltransferase domain-containing protein [Halobacillus sp. A5]
MLEDTGERVIPKEMDAMNGLLLEHVARYHFSEPYIKGRVLDIACGVGYGAAHLAKTKKHTIDEILGVDICIETIQYAIHNYYHPLLTFKAGDILAEEWVSGAGQFDTIVSFETIEHVPDVNKFMNHMHQLLAPGGCLLLSTPFGKGLNHPSGSPFHYFQMTPAEFEGLFAEFSEVEIFYQNGVTIEPPRSGVYYPLGVAVCRK